MKNTFFGELLKKKIDRNEVCFLKPNVLGPIDCKGGVVGNISCLSSCILILKNNDHVICIDVSMYMMKKLKNIMKLSK